MTKKPKITIKNSQLSQALNLGKKLEKKAPAPKKMAAAKPKAKASAKPSADAKPKQPLAKIKKVVKEKPAPEPIEEKVVEQAPGPEVKTEEVKEVKQEPKPVRRIQLPKRTPPPSSKPTTEQKEQPEKRRIDLKKQKPAGPKAKKYEIFNKRDRTGLSVGEERRLGGKRKKGHKIKAPAQPVVRPSELKVKLPVTVKELAAAMKLKSAEIITKLLMQGLNLTINDLLEDETTVQLIGHEFKCEIEIDTSEEERLRITDKSIQEEIKLTDPDKLKARPPVVAFMGHVDHGKTSLIDAIRKSNITAKEAGSITQHIGAFRAFTSRGEVTILDTPGHEAFSEMRERGATVTDVVILVVAGDEGMKPQTDEAMHQALEAGVPIVVAINKSDKPEFDPDTVYRQLADRELLPEAWGGETLTVNCSAHTGEGIDPLLETALLQAEMLELRAQHDTRARGTILESELSRGFGPIATVLVQNGTLKKGDALVIDSFYGRVKTMHDEHQKTTLEAHPSCPVKITGLSGLPTAGSEFIVVDSEKEARKLCAERSAGTARVPTKRKPFEDIVQRTQQLQAKKVFPIVLRADVQGSLEAVKQSLSKIPQGKIEINIITDGVGQISESDVDLATASGATIIGFHTGVESHAEPFIKRGDITVKLYDIIYHLVDGVKEMMVNCLDKTSEEKEVGAAEVKAAFKSSALGVIAGCQVTEGLINRKHQIKQFRGDEQIWQGSIASLKRVKEDVKEVAKGIECGIVLAGSNDIQVGDTFRTFEIIYHTQTLD